VLPTCHSQAMQLHLDEIATNVAPGAHAILILLPGPDTAESRGKPCGA
jgi:hypothetical protein